MILDNTSSFGVLFLTIASIDFLQLQTIRSQTPLKYGATVGFEIPFHFLLHQRLLNVRLVPGCYPVSNLLAVPTRFVPLSRKLTLGFPFCATDLVKAPRHASVSKLGTISTWTALVKKHVKIQHHRFFFIFSRISLQMVQISVLQYWHMGAFFPHVFL